MRKREHDLFTSSGNFICWRGCLIIYQEPLLTFKRKSYGDLEVRFLDNILYLIGVVEVEERSLVPVNSPACPETCALCPQTEDVMVFPNGVLEIAHMSPCQRSLGFALGNSLNLTDIQILHL